MESRKGKRRKNSNVKYEINPYRYLIVCEGTKTEPNYFKGIQEQINRKYKNKFSVHTHAIKPEIVIEGTGRNTESLVEFAIELRKNANIPYGKVWCVFDKDDFSDAQFNNAIQKCNANDIEAAWSNEAIELWFLLHFEYLNSGISRKQYGEKLSKIFKDKNINNGKYVKNMDNIYEVLAEHGSVANALKNAKKLDSNHNDLGAKCNPCTIVYKIVSELEEYLK